MSHMSHFRSFIKNPERTGFDGEDADEHILYIVRRSFITNIYWIFGSILIFLAPVVFNYVIFALNNQNSGFIPAEFTFVLNIFWYLFAFGFIFEKLLGWFFNVNIITSKRIVDMDFFSLLRRNVSDAPLRNIEDITFTTHGLLSTIFDFGTVSIQTAAETREFEFEDVPNPQHVQDILSDLVRDIRARPL